MCSYQGTEQWNETSELILKERQLIQEVAELMANLSTMHIKTYEGIEKWKWEKQADATLIENMKKVAEIDLAEHIERNIQKDPEKIMADALQKEVKTNEKKKDIEKKKAARIESKKNKNNKKQLDENNKNNIRKSNEKKREDPPTQTQQQQQ